MLCLFREATAKNLKHREKQKDLHNARGSFSSSQEVGAGPDCKTERRSAQIQNCPVQSR